MSCVSQCLNSGTHTYAPDDWQFDVLADNIMERLLFATSVMHAYGHQWACQLIYNPRLREGLGLTEGEGTERIWSKFRKLIGVTRSSGVCDLCPQCKQVFLTSDDSALDEYGYWIDTPMLSMRLLATALVGGFEHVSKMA